MSGEAANAAVAVEAVAESAARTAAVETAAAVATSVAAAQTEAAATVTAAETAVAMANATAAAAELDAAERVRALVQGLDQWRTEVVATLATILDRLTAAETATAQIATIVSELSSVKERLLLIPVPQATGTEAPAGTVNPAQPVVAVVESPAAKTSQNRRRLI